MIVYCDYCREDKDESEFSPSDFARYLVPFVERGRFWRVACRVCRNYYNRTRYRRARLVQPHTAEDRYFMYIKSTYNLSREDYAAMLEDQGSVCKLCKLPNYRGGVQVRLCVDHDHVNQQVRGLLCYKCNSKVSYYEVRFRGGDVGIQQVYDQGNEVTRNVIDYAKTARLQHRTPPPPSRLTWQESLAILEAEDAARLKSPPHTPPLS